MLQISGTSINIEIPTVIWVHYVNLKVIKQLISKADQASEDVHIAMLAYQVPPRGPGKLSPPEAMTQHKFEALLLVKQWLSAQLHERQRYYDSAEAGTS